MTNHPQIKSTNPENVVLSVQNLEKVFTAKGKPPTPALRGVSLDALAGWVTGLVGADGAGKARSWEVRKIGGWEKDFGKRICILFPKPAAPEAIGYR